MTIIKAQDAKLRASDFRAPTPPVSDPTAPLRAEIAALVDALRDADVRLAECAVQMKDLRAQADAAFDEGKKAGHALGYADGCADRSEALQRLEASLGAAHADLHARLEATDQLALMLAQEALGRLIDDPAHRANLLRETIQRHLKTVEVASVVRLVVSSDDFPDLQELVELAAKSGVTDTKVEASPRMERGGCRIELVLGELEIGLDSQWKRLNDRLSAIGEEGGA